MKIDARVNRINILVANTMTRNSFQFVTASIKVEDLPSLLEEGDAYLKERLQLNESISIEEAKNAIIKFCTIAIADWHENHTHEKSTMWLSLLMRLTTLLKDDPLLMGVRGILLNLNLNAMEEDGGLFPYENLKDYRRHAERFFKKNRVLSI